MKKTSMTEAEEPPALIMALKKITSSIKTWGTNIKKYPNRAPVSEGFLHCFNNFFTRSETYEYMKDKYSSVMPVKQMDWLIQHLVAVSSIGQKAFDAYTKRSTEMKKVREAMREAILAEEVLESEKTDVYQSSYDKFFTVEEVVEIMNQKFGEGREIVEKRFAALMKQNCANESEEKDYKSKSKIRARRRTMLEICFEEFYSINELLEKLSSFNDTDEDAIQSEFYHQADLRGLNFQEFAETAEVRCEKRKSSRAWDKVMRDMPASCSAEIATLPEHEKELLAYWTRSLKGDNVVPVKDGNQYALLRHEKEGDHYLWCSCFWCFKHQWNLMAQSNYSEVIIESINEFYRTTDPTDPTEVRILSYVKHLCVFWD